MAITSTGSKRQRQQEQEVASQAMNAAVAEQIDYEKEFEYVEDNNDVEDDEDENDWNAVAQLLQDVASQDVDDQGQHGAASGETEAIIDDDEEQLKQLDALVLNDASLWLSLPPPLPLSITGSFDDGSLYYGDADSYGLVGEGIMIPPVDGGDDISATTISAPLSMSMSCSIVSASSDNYSSTFSVSSSSNTSSRSNSPIFDHTLNGIENMLGTPMTTSSSSSSLSVDSSESAIAIAAATAAAVATGEDSASSKKDDVVTSLCGKEWLQPHQQQGEGPEEGNEALSAVSTTTTTTSAPDTGKGKDGAKKKKRKSKASSLSSSLDDTEGEGGEAADAKNKRSRRYSYLKPEVVEYLRTWMMSPEHVKHPYPTDQEKRKIMDDTGLELKQLMNWFVNNRKRYWKPRVENKKKQQEEQDQQQQQQLLQRTN